MLKTILLVGFTVYFLVSVPLMIWRGFASRSVIEDKGYVVWYVINRKESPALFWFQVGLYAVVGVALTVSLVNKWL